ncbi:anhydro-N-acetylmuramic acid kinase [Rhodoferax saidenbachensis]|uniref:Anhydro-N-acetylmuramic acid kinase n=1 Tax=Rhodoferax saidenbachensis TaxID=1484693 RepID=A0ABU1ZT72_9BURK|nr:anhydro-N-acetylmuramic acid kinase [Rhodoferax saidenbachensis]MDR7308126.1 anhydro-N-acetylmuramic acid kinase [Rhodoferax saidenbachensis]
MSELFIGLMSGTSMDGVDGVLADFSQGRMRVLQHCSAPLPAALQSELLALNTPADNELHRAALAGNGLARVYAEVVANLLRDGDTPKSAVRAIGAHGQTVRHRPQEFDGTGYTLQLNQPALLAELCGIDVVADFRSRDVAAGGQGAPLVPPFHQAFFGQDGCAMAVLNIGGISNITVLDHSADAPVQGFDCGPGNALMDGWCQTHIGQAFDDAGSWAAGGQVHAALLASLLNEPFFAKPPPKSTGRDLFNAAWLARCLSKVTGVSPQDVQATLTELTARSCAEALRKVAPHCKTLVVCGGGAFNTHLMQRLAHHLPGCAVESSEAQGLPPLQVEASAFAWLARQTCLRQTASLQKVTGALGARILGAIYPA